MSNDVRSFHIPLIQKSPVPTYIPYCHFNSKTIDRLCREKWNKPFSQLDSNVRAELIDEYRRLRELPSLNLVSSESCWNEVQKEFSGDRFVFRTRTNFN